MDVLRDIDVFFLCSAMNGDLPLIQKLLRDFENGEGPGKVLYAALRTPKGQDALHLAAQAQKTEVCRFLLENLKFDINGSTAVTGETPLSLSIQHRDQERDRETTVFLIDSGADVMKPNIKGQTPLHRAAYHGSREMVKLLLSKGADLNAISDVGTPLHAAALSANHDVLEYLLDLKANPNPTISSYDKTPLFASLKSKSFRCVELLLKAGADPNCACYLATPLHFAVSFLDVGIIMLLLESGANPNIPGPLGHTPLEHAALNRRWEVVALLFPVTSRIQCFQDWSILGVIMHAESETTRNLLRSKLKEECLLRKADGEEAFKRGNYVDAIEWYTKAAQADPSDVKVISNRSLCFARKNMARGALADAQRCVELAPSWAKAHYREGAAWNLLKRFTKAAEAFSRALALDPNNRESELAFMANEMEQKKFSSWEEGYY